MPHRTAGAAVSIIICTANRPAALRETLSSLQGTHVPPGWDVELIVVDNAPSDSTRAVVQCFDWQGVHVRYLSESRRGKGHALNTGIAASTGDVLLFTDDDVRPSREWLTKISEPLLLNQADAVGGRVRLAPHLERPWLTDDYKRWLAWCEEPDPRFPNELIGANMGLRRSVLSVIPGFDPELGPGAAGLGEDTLIGWQLERGAFRVRFAPDAMVEHHPDLSRLLRSAWLRMAQAHGRKDAYLLHHWKHQILSAPAARMLWLRLKLAVRRRVQPPIPLDSEGCTRWEMSYVGDIEMCGAYLRERRRTRNYERYGLQRLDSLSGTLDLPGGRQ